jgi:hypothetical protein
MTYTNGATPRVLPVVDALTDRTGRSHTPFSRGVRRTNHSVEEHDGPLGRCVSIGGSAPAMGG